ncbi:MULTISPECIES: hypothetical protein [unclassified Streptomyces]
MARRPRVSAASDRCLQLFGDYGYMLEYPIAPLCADAVIIAESLGL